MWKLKIITFTLITITTISMGLYETWSRVATERQLESQLWTCERQYLQCEFQNLQAKKQKLKQDCSVIQDACQEESYQTKATTRKQHYLLLAQIRTTLYQKYISIATRTNDFYLWLEWPSMRNNTIHSLLQILAAVLTKIWTRANRTLCTHGWRWTDACWSAAAHN